MRTLGLVLWTLLLFAPAAGAQRLPLRNYTVADGLPHLSVRVLLQDSRGYLWIGTPDGLARYDGSAFVTYGREHGLPSTAITHLSEDPNGTLWLATHGGGIARMLRLPAFQASGASAPARRFEAFTIAAAPMANRVNAIAVDPAGSIWAVTDNGVYRGDEPENGELPFERVRDGGFIEWSHSIAKSRDRLWLAHMTNVLEIAGGRLIDRGPAASEGPRSTAITAMVAAPDGTLFVATPLGVSRVEPADAPGAGRTERLPLPLVTGEWISSLAAAGDTLWIGTSAGLLRWTRGSVTRFGSEQGLGNVLALTLDREGHLWIGGDAGLHMLVTDSSTLFSLSRNKSDSAGTRLVEDRKGRIFASASKGIARLDRGTVEWVPRSGHGKFGRIGDRFVQDGAGHWWVATDDQLFWIPGPELRFDQARPVTAAHGFPSPASVVRLLEGRGTSIWVSSGTPDGLYACAADGGGPRCRLHLQDSGAVLRLATAPGDRLWLARFAPLAFLDRDRVATLSPTTGLPDTNARSFLLDSRGWLWIGLRSHGVSVTETPSAPAPVYRNYSTEDGLASGFVRAMVEDRDGRVYLATDRGIDRLDPRTHRITHLGPERGLDDSPVRDLLMARDGRLWATLAAGVLRITEPTRASIPKPQGPYLTRVSVRGEDRLAATLGVPALDEMVLAPRQNDIQIEYGAITFTRAPLRYQYKLEPVQATWSHAMRDRSVHFAHLPAGSYRFVVRALGPDGAPLPHEAVARFRIEPAVWRTWWFMALAAAAAAGGIFGWHRARLRRLLALARTRQQIAMDLHDDIGAGLVEVAILGELARRDAQPKAAAPLARVIGLARSMRESMADIVWAIDPERDHLVDAVQRLRDTAFNLAGVGSGQLLFTAPTEAELARVTLAPERRRALLLIFKEALANVLRHAGNCRIRIDLSIAADMLHLQIEDDGCGFDPSVATDGNGLRNLARRASALAGTLSIDSVRGQGTRVSLAMPLDRLPIWGVGGRRGTR